MVTPAGFEEFWREPAQLPWDAPAAVHQELGRKFGVRAVRTP